MTLTETHGIELDRAVTMQPDAVANAPGVVVGDWLYLSSHAGVDADGAVVSTSFDAQVDAAFRNLERTLAAGGSSLADVYHMTVWLTDMRLADAFLDRRREAMDETRVTTTLVGADTLIDPEARVEIEARAVRTDGALSPTVVDVPDLPDPAAISPNHATCVTVGDLVYLSGQPGVDEGGDLVSIDFGDQMRRVLENVRTGLDAGGSDTGDMATMTTWMTDHRERPAFHSMRSELLGTDVTTSTRIATTDLADVESFVQMEVVGVDSAVGKEMVDHPEELALATMERDGETYPRFWQCVRAGEWLFTAGMVAVDAEFRTVSPYFEAQTRAIFENLDIALAAAGAGFGDLVHTRTYLTDMRYADEYLALRDDILGDATASSTVTQTPLLAETDFRLEVEAIARAPE